MTTYYVNKEHGNNSNDGLSHLTAWLTLDRAFERLTAWEVPTSTVLIGPGTYAENSGGNNFLYILNVPAFVDWVTFEAENPLQRPLITGNGSTACTVDLQMGGYIRFKNLDFSDTDSATGKSAGMFYIPGNSSISNLEFENCTFTWTTPDGTNLYAFRCSVPDGKTMQNWAFNHCTFIQNGTGYSGSTAIRLTNDIGSTTAVFDTITLHECTIDIFQLPVEFNGITNLLIDGGHFHSGNTYGIILGEDGSGTWSTYGTVKNAYIKSENSHSLLVEGKCDSTVVTGCTIIGGDNALVVKENTEVTITANVLSGGSVNTLYFKAAAGCYVAENIISNIVGTCVRVGWNSSTSNKCSGINFQRNKVFASGSARLFDWGDASDDDGGGLCDYNVYRPSGTYKLGTIYGSADSLATLAAMITAWSTYSNPLNDTHSRLLLPPPPSRQGARR